MGISSGFVLLPYCIVFFFSSMMFYCDRIIELWPKGVSTPKSIVEKTTLGINVKWKLLAVEATASSGWEDVAKDTGTLLWLLIYFSGVCRYSFIIWA